MNIPWAIPNINNEDKEYVKGIINSGWYSMGKEVKKLEEGMKKWTNREYCIATTNGTTALEVMLKGLGVGKGDEVIIPALTYIATAYGISNVGATPIFVDVNDTMTINPKLIEEKISSKTKLIMTVDLIGYPCDYDSIVDICDTHQIQLVVDGAQSLCVMYNGVPTIKYGIASTISFHSAKILTTVEGGMIFTDSEELNDRFRMIRNQGEGKTKYIHEELGSNCRLSDVHAGFGVSQLNRLDKTMKHRRDLVRHYEKECKSRGIRFVDVPDKNNFIFIILYNKRNALAEYLKQNGVDTRIIYPMTVPQQPLYNSKQSFHKAEWFSNHSLSLPLYNDLTKKDIDYIIKKIGEF